MANKIIENVLGRLGFYSKANFAKLAKEGYLPKWYLQGAEMANQAMPDYTQYQSQANLFQKLSWINISITLLSYAAASADYEVTKLVDDKQKPVINHELEQLLLRPNPEQSKFDFFQHTFAFLALNGNAYWHIVRPDKDSIPIELWVIPSGYIRPVMSKKVGVEHYVYNLGDEKPVIIPKENVLHIKRWNPRNMYIGGSQIESVSVVSEADLSMQKYNSNFFGKQNAKIPGALAFKDNIPDNAFETLKRELQEQWGGVGRYGPLLLRNVGDGVNWIKMALTQQEMDFISSRNMNRDEIFSTYAPGLLSMISPDSTEANARIGKATFTEFTLWPMMTMLAEKITNQMLPLYGNDLSFTYKDIRITDELITIRKQREYATIHTIDETRKKFYDDVPLPSGKGDMLLAEVGSQSSDFSFREREGGGDTDVGRDGRTAQEIKSWEKFEINRFGKKNARKFECKYIPETVEDIIRGDLLKCRTKQDIIDLFEEAERLVKFA